jgi:hypothetical protein
MGFFSRGTKEDHSDWVPEKAFVLDAEAPLEHAPSFGKGSQHSIGLLIDSGAGARQLSVHAKHDADKWLVPGMDVGVRVDPGDADHVEIAWEELPSIEARVAAGDPALVDPIGAERRVSQARRLPPSDRAERLKEALAAAAAAPAPPGKVRAVAIVATIRGRSRIDGYGDHATSYSDDSAAVLSINMPGRAPYAVFEPKFKCPKGMEAAVSQELPALVSAGDPSEIEVVWAEVQSDATYSAGLVADRLAGWTAEKAGQERSLADAGGAASEAIAAGSPNDAADTIAGLMASMTQALGGAAPGATPPGVTPPGVFNADAIAQQRAASIKAALARTQDPAARKAMIDNFRAMGYEVDADDVTG